MNAQSNNQIEKAKILIVDDQENNLVAMSQTLEKLDAEIYLAHSGMEALKLVTQHEFAVVLLDMYMPEMDGFETAELMRKNKYTELIPIVFVTAVSKEKLHVLKGYRAGAVDYLFKPIDPYILKSKVQIFLNIYYQKTQRIGKIMRELQEVRSALEKSNKALKEIENHDPITELPNRKELESEINRCMNYARQHQSEFAVLNIHINNWKLISDLYGYQVGDKILKLAAKKLFSGIGHEGFMAHFGEDKFYAILSKINHFNDAGKIATKLTQLLQEPMDIADNKISLNLSIGIACYPLAGNTVVDLIKNAEIAMYRARLLDNHNWYFFNKELHDQYNNRLMIERTLRQALERNEFYLVYQIIYRLKDKKPTGVEALLRWKHPVLGDISPIDFIPVAEDTGLISQIGKWVIDQACQQFSEWSDLGFENVCFSINLSPEQLQQGDLVELMKKAVSRVRLKSNRLELELSEAAIMQHNYGANQLLNELHQIGLKITIDNFGTSVSSFSILNNLYIDTLKIDRTFVRQITLDSNVAVIVKAIIAISKGLDLRIIAEGIETQEQLDFFVREGCDEGQGFYLGNPLSADKVAQYFVGSQHHVD